MQLQWTIFLVDEVENDSEERIEAVNDSVRPKRAIDDERSMEGVLKTELKFWNQWNMALQRQMRLLDDRSNMEWQLKALCMLAKITILFNVNMYTI